MSTSHWLKNFFTGFSIPFKSRVPAPAGSLCAPGAALMPVGSRSLRQHALQGEFPGFPGSALLSSYRSLALGCLSACLPPPPLLQTPRHRADPSPWQTQGPPSPHGTEYCCCRCSWSPLRPRVISSLLLLLLFFKTRGQKPVGR